MNFPVLLLSLIGVTCSLYCHCYCERRHMEDTCVKCMEHWFDDTNWVNLGESFIPFHFIYHKSHVESLLWSNLGHRSELCVTYCCNISSGAVTLLCWGFWGIATVVFLLQNYISRPSALDRIVCYCIFMFLFSGLLLTQWNRRHF